MTQEQWQAIKNGDASSDGQFFCGRKTTKIVCRPSCPAQSRVPKNIVVFDTLDDAIQMGYRPCSRCHPELEHWEGAKKELARSAEAFIRSHYQDKFSLDALARELHVDKSYLLRTFKEVMGSTLLQYHNQVRCEAAKELLTHSELSVSYIAAAVGYASPSHFTVIFRKIVGCTPSEYRNHYLQSLDA